MITFSLARPGREALSRRFRRRIMAPAASLAVLGLACLYATPVLTNPAEPSFPGDTAMHESSRVSTNTLVDLPSGLDAVDWQRIRGTLEADRHAVVSDPQNPGRWHARNPGQRWRTEFDGAGFVTRPDHRSWTWGLALSGWGHVGAIRSPAERPLVEVDGQRTAYRWSDVLEEWFINDERGLEHGFTVKRAPRGAEAGDARSAVDRDRLRFELAVRGGLRPVAADDGRNVRFVDDAGRTALTYSGLTAWDATGRVLAARFDPDGDVLALEVDANAVVYPVTIDPVAQQAYLKASNVESGDFFGYSVAVSGNTAVVGAPYEASSATGVDGNQADNSANLSGAAYVFVRDGATWTQQAYLKASNGEAGDFFGVSASISGDTVVIGARQESSGATGVNGDQNDNSESLAGAAYVFVRDGDTWSQQAYLKASNAEANDLFGEAVAVSGDTVVVGAQGEASGATGVNGDQDDNGVRSGAAYVFVRDGTVWSQQAYLKASNGEAVDGFGISVAISGDTVVVGASRESGAATGVNGDQSSNSAQQAGAAYVFFRVGTTWSQQAYLKASNTDINDQFGHSLAISGDTVVVGALFEDGGSAGIDGNQADNSKEHSGAAYVFVRDGATWTQQAYLKASNTEIHDAFGQSLAVSGNTVVVSAHLEDSGSAGIDGNQADNSAVDSGAVYVFTRDGATWSQAAYLKASNTDQNDHFGNKLAMSGDTVVVGALNEDSMAAGINGNQLDDSALSSGAAYVFTLTSPRAPVSDFDADSHSDLLWQNTASGRNVMWFMDGVNRKSSGDTLSVFDDDWSLSGFGDFNGDGSADLLWRSTSSGRNVIWLMDGLTRIGHGDTVALNNVGQSGWYLPGIEDFDGDGKADLLWRNVYTGRNVIWFMDGATRTGAGDALGLSHPHWDLAGFGDFNGDGRTDLLWRNSFNGRNVIWLMDGLTRIGHGDTVVLNDPAWELVGLEDFDGDNRTDFLWRNTVNGRHVMWFMDGTTRTGAGDTLGLNHPDWSLAGFGDYNGDGRSDFLWHNDVNGRNVMWLMDGTTRIGAGDTVTLPFDPWFPRLRPVVTRPPVLPH